MIVHGHWHGSGGSGVNEWRAWKLSGSYKLTMFIDCVEAEWINAEENRYDIYDLETGKDDRFMAADAPEYDALYAAHVAPSIPSSQYRRYALNDPSGLDVIQ